ncbi:MAG TPA: ABC transporter permease [Anaerolineae bacterium]|nr:ABC transporter permease [Anaerolineae bacterium]HIQ06300.1 ABC transporter permease [Anaerolineae bacterium]
MRFGEAVRELLRSGPGRAGVALLALLFVGSLYVLAAYPLDFGTRVWSNPAVWADNPKAVPPAWTNLLRSEPQVEHRVLELRKPVQVARAMAGEIRLYRFRLDYPFRQPPTSLSLALAGISYQSRPPLITMSVVRPDGKEMPLYRHVVRAPRPGESPPIRRYHETPLRVQLSTDPVVASAVRDFLRAQYGVEATDAEVMDQLDHAIFGVPERGDRLRFRPLTGTYEFRVRAMVADEANEVGLVRIVVGGAVFGLMGTDAVGRDLAQGLLFGLPVALFIGLAASTLSTGIGASLGITSGYLGGRTDLIIQRLADIVANVPVLPLLIFMVFVLGSHLFLIILILVAFSWPGLTILVRSMVLQMRSQQLVEAIRSLGASHWRIMFRHIFPQTAPYVFAQMIFFAPSAILAEAALSFLGLGDPSIPTWGQILEHGFRTGGVYVGYWWWIVPPGLLIVLTAVTFMLIALGMEPVMDPRLRKTL